MKTKKWRKALTAGCVTGGLTTAAQAALLDVNLVLNSSFETVDLASIGNYNGPRILDWVGTAFAYSHDGSASGNGIVPNYADGGPLAGGGHWYFSANNSPPSADIHDPDLFFQDITLSGGATGSAIANGQAGYELSAFMSSYLNDADFGNVRVDFRDAANGLLGFRLISDIDFGPNNVWTLNSAQGVVPIGTAAVRVSVYGTAATGGADGYIDNVDFRLFAIPEPSTGGAVVLAWGALGLGRRRRRAST